MPPSHPRHPRHALRRCAGCLTLLVLLLTACGHASAPADRDEAPAAALRTLIDDLQRNDLAAVWQHALPQSERASVARRWRAWLDAPGPNGASRRQQLTALAPATGRAGRTRHPGRAAAGARHRAGSPLR